MFLIVRKKMVSMSPNHPLSPWDIESVFFLEPITKGDPLPILDVADGGLEVHSQPEVLE
jgi:hypothetical protein